MKRIYIKKAFLIQPLKFSYKVLLLTIISVLFMNAEATERIDIKVSLDLKNVTLVELFSTIEAQTNYTFFYRNKDIDTNTTITIKANKKPVNLILNSIFKNNGITYKVLKNQIIISKISSFDINQQTLQGIVTDFNTGKGITFCSVSVKGTYKGTSTNDLGAFIVNTDALPVALVFNHIGYEEQTITITNNDPINIQLIPLATVLDEVLLNTTYNDDRSINLANAAIENMQRLSVKTKYGQAFYRQKSKNGDDYSELAEIIFDTKYNTNGIIDWAILEGRYALKEAKINNKNFTLLSKLLKTTQPDTEDLIFPLREDFERFYNVKTLEQLTSEKKQITVLQFKPKNKKNKIPVFEGEVYINTATNNVLKVRGSINRDDLKLITLGEDASKEGYGLTYEINLKEDPIFDLVIDYVKLNHKFKYYKDGAFITKVSAESVLSFFNYYQPTTQKKLGSEFSFRDSDWEKLNKIGYNKVFWENNPIVKRTPVEESVIASFEKDNSFEIIYLNSNDQISLSGSDISDDLFVKTLNQKIKDYDSIYPVEKVYLHTNKDYFFNGDILYYSIYHPLGLKEETNSSKIVYVDLLDSDSKIVASKMHRLDFGQSTGDIAIKTNLPVGKYYLRAYTTWMKNFDTNYFFTKPITVISNTLSNDKVNSTVNETIDLQFFPEGGTAIVGLNNKIAFKATGSDGFNENISAKIINSKQETIAFINTIDNGSGFFNLIPQINESYYAVLNDSISYPITNIVNRGYNMRVNNLSEKSIRLTLQSSDDLRTQDFYIIGQINQKLVYQGKFNFSSKETLVVEVPKSKLPSGVMTLTIFDANKNPVAERAVFINNQQELVISAKVDKKSFDKREKIGLEITVTDTYGSPVSTNLSVAVTDIKAVKENINASNILTYLLLESDIKGYIKNPARFFKDKERSTRAKLDLLMLTHGWRRIKLEELNHTKLYDFEEGYQISGVVKNLDSVNIGNINLKVIVESNEGKGFYETKSDNKGRFTINNIKEFGKVKVFFRGFNFNNKARGINIVLDNTTSNVPTTNFKQRFYNIPINFLNIKEDSAKNTFKFTKNLEQYSKYSMLDGIELEEVTINTEVEIKENFFSAPSVYGIKPDATVYVDETSPRTNFLYLLNKVAGVRASGAFNQNGQSTVIIRGRGNPLWVIDGVPQPRPESGPSYQSPPPTPIPNSVAVLNTSEIERIEVLKGPKKAIFGSAGSDGVILIYTKRTTAKKSAKSSVFNDIGYDIPREFYMPNYEVKTPDNQKPDYRSALYWNSSVKTDTTGKAYFEFFNSDIAKQLQVSIEGLSKTGLPGYFLQTFGEK